MGQIEQIIDLITLSDDNLESALLKCKVIARRLQYQPLQQWVEGEVSGYHETAILPEYRKFISDPTGLLTNGFQWVEHKSVDPYVVGVELYERLRTVNVYEAIGVVNSLKGENTLRRPLSVYESEVNQKYREHMGGGFGFIGLAAPVSPGTFESVISSVRNQLLNFLLDMEEIFPEDQDLKYPTPEQKASVDQSFIQNLNVYGNANVAIGSNATIASNPTSIEVIIQEGNTNELRSFLIEQGLNNDDIDELDPLLGSVYEGRIDEVQKTFLSSWINSKAAKVSARVAEGVTSIVVGETIVKALSEYAPKANEILQSIPII